ncbi:MAG: transposase [Dehalococcoidia bacterium]|nr:transposase [Dehalococcoidia bacterium]
MATVLAAGIDISADFLDLAFSDAPEVERFPHNRAGLRSLVRALRPRKVRKVVVEASGGYEADVEDTLSAAGLPVVVVAPERPQALRRALGQSAKTDALDARLLTRYGAMLELPARPRPDAAARELRSLVAHRRRLQAEIAEAQRAYPVRQHPTVVRLRRQLAQLLRRQRDELDRAIAAALASDPVWAERDRVLRTVPGVGPVVSSTLIAVPGTGHAQPQGGGGAGGTGPVQPRERDAPGTAADRRRARLGAPRPLLGRDRRRPPQPVAQAHLRPPARCWQAQEARPHGLLPPDPARPERDGPLRPHLGPRLGLRQLLSRLGGRGLG